ncbi:DMT family transporter [Actinomyces naeslundii]|uniref:DMT family transporter n=1 Tax=Actinomyces naeslundii TaxID=1655 RepID=UPI00094CF466|nr:multidrug efflux SMR transporter [Actinomyces naeslundii]OLO90376.1 QacE family quaternary ammonium compound efflux SMR transporter [Actinomyces naeslundii]
MSGVYLVAAIASETTGTLSLKLASDGRGLRWYAVVMGGYLAAFAMLTVTLKTGMPLGVAYGVWSAGGVAVTAIASRLLFGEPLTRTMVAGIALIMAGVLLVEIGSTH